MKQSIVLKKPVITEKSMADAQNGVFTFEVDRDANKNQIRKTAEELFKVNVIKVTTVTTKPEIKRTGKKRLLNKVGGAKLARIWLKEGQKIELFEFKENK